jgi:hypothetical protein
MNVREIECEVGDRIQLAEDRVQCRHFVKIRAP